MENKQGNLPVKRFEFIDISKAIAIFFVLMGHSIDSDTMYKTVIYSFHMPLFFIISGAVTKSKNSYTLKTMLESIKKKLWTLYFPYFLWALIYARFSFKNLLFIIWGTRETLIKADCLTSLWFLPVLLIASVIIECVQAVIVRFGMKRVISYIIFASACFLIGFLAPHNSAYGNPMGIDIGFVAAAFMLTGRIIMEIYAKLPGKKLIWNISCFFSSLIVLVLYFVYFTPTGYVLMANAVYGNTIRFLFTSFAGSILVLSFSCLTERVLCRSKIILFIGRNTLGIFILHKPFVELFCKCMTTVGFDYNNIVCILLNTIATLCIVVPLLYLINKYVPFVFGKIKIEGSAKKNE